MRRAVSSTTCRRRFRRSKQSAATARFQWRARGRIMSIPRMSAIRAFIPSGADSACACLGLLCRLGHEAVGFVRKFSITRQCCVSSKNASAFKRKISATGVERCCGDLTSCLSIFKPPNQRLEEPHLAEHGRISSNECTAKSRHSPMLTIPQEQSPTAQDADPQRLARALPYELSRTWTRSRTANSRLILYNSGEAWRGVSGL